MYFHQFLSHFLPSNTPLHFVQFFSPSFNHWFYSMGFIYSTLSICIDLESSMNYCQETSQVPHPKRRPTLLFQISSVANNLRDSNLPMLLCSLVLARQELYNWAKSPTWIYSLFEFTYHNLLQEIILYLP